MNNNGYILSAINVLNVDIQMSLFVIVVRVANHIIVKNGRKHNFQVHIVLLIIFFDSAKQQKQHQGDYCRINMSQKDDICYGDRDCDFEICSTLFNQLRQRIQDQE